MRESERAWERVRERWRQSEREQRREREERERGRERKYSSSSCEAKPSSLNPNHKQELHNYVFPFTYHIFPQFNSGNAGNAHFLLDYFDSSKRNTCALNIYEVIERRQNLHFCLWKKEMHLQKPMKEITLRVEGQHDLSRPRFYQLPVKIKQLSIVV